MSDFIGIVIAIYAGLMIFCLMGYLRRQAQLEKIREMASNKAWIPVSEFLENKNNMKDFVGIYIIWNLANDKYYVGQGKSVIQRCANHFCGRGCADLYYDYRSNCDGKSIQVKFIKLTESGYDNINDLERDNIEAYEAYTKGYNKTRGNK